MPTQIVFFGSSPFSIIVLEKLLSAEGCELRAVVTNPDKPVGRHLKLTPNPVKVLAQKHNILVFDNIHDFLTQNWPNCLGLIAAYGKLIGPKTLSKLNNQIFGIHPSLLPKYRGPSPLQQQILDGVTETGVTIIQLDVLMDHGPIVAVAHDKILPGDTTETLGNRLFEKGANLFLNLLNTEHQTLNIQNEAGASYTHKLTRQDGFVPYQELGARSQELERMKRAFSPWPGVWTIDPQGKRIKLDL